MADGTQTEHADYPFTRWNFIIIVIDASFWTAALAFVDPVAVLPVLLINLTGSPVVIGLLTALQRAGWLLPQLLTTSLVLHRPRRKPFVLYPCIASRLPFLSLAVLLNLRWAASHPQAVLLLLVAVYAVFFVGEGVVGVPWHDIISRTIPPGLRGRFFGGMMFVGGLLAVGAGAIVRHVLADPSLPFPHNYGRLFVLLFICMMLSTAFVALIREPQAPTTRERQSLSHIIRSIPTTLRRHPRLRRGIIAQNLLGLAGLALPFYAVYAHSRLHLPEAAGGIFIWAGIVGSVSASLVWAYLSDRFGSTAVIRGVALLVVAVPLSALLVPLLVRSAGLQEAAPYLYAVVFMLNGATWGGMWLGFTNYVLEISSTAIRPLFLGLQAALMAPTVVAPLLGGWMLGFLSYEVLFAIVAACGAAGVIYVRRLEEPRRLLPPDLGTSQAGHPPKDGVAFERAEP